jgi:hypothetical protein
MPEALPIPARPAGKLATASKKILPRLRHRREITMWDDRTTRSPRLRFRFAGSLWLR